MDERRDYMGDWGHQINDTPATWEKTRLEKPDRIPWGEYLGEKLQTRDVQCGNIYFVGGPENYLDYDGPILPFPNSSIHAIALARAEEHPLYEQISQASDLYRLGGIRQLSILGDSSVHPAHLVGFDTAYSQNRLEHSWLVGALTETVLRINNRPEQEITEAVVAAVLHDSATVAGGDTMKMVAPNELNEEELVRRLMEKPDVIALFHGLKLDERDVYDIVRHKGANRDKQVIGEVMDLADRIGYTCRDASIAAQLHRATQNSLGGRLPEQMPSQVYLNKCAEVQAILDADPKLFDLIFDIKIDAAGNVVVENTDRLKKFLKVRAYMFRDVYMDPIAHMAEMTILIPALKSLWTAGRLSVENLTEWQNRDLEEILAEALQISGGGLALYSHISNQLRREDVQVTEATSATAALALKRKLNRDGRQIVAEDSKLAGFSPATKILVPTPTEPRPFKDVFPAAAAEIQGIVKQTQTIRIYHAKKPVTK